MQDPIYATIVKVAVLLIAAKAFGEVVSRLSFPSVLGEIIAGVLLGPSVLGWIKPSITLQTIATIGIILLLFLAGLDIDLEMVREVGAAAFFIALAGVLVPMTAGVLVFVALGYTLKSSVFIGSILTATSIGLTLRTLMDMGRFRTRTGTTIVTAAVIDDVMGIFILTLLVSIDVAGKTPSVWYILELVVLVIGFFAVSILIGLWLAKYVTRWLSKLWVDEALLAFAICLAIAIGWVASNFKVAEITGAFIAGLMLNNTSEQKVISEKVSVVGYGFFIPIFFAYIGVSTSLSSLVKAGYAVLAFIGIAIIGKVIGCAAVARPWFNTRESIAIGTGMIPRAEVALIMATLGLHAHVIDSKIFAMTVAMVFVTNILTPILLRLAFRWVQAHEPVGADGVTDALQQEG
jgi:Na+:H+ antiporter